LKPAGIVSYGYHIPVYRLSRDLIAEAWGSKSLGGQRAVANFDEDALTMATHAAWKNLTDGAASEIDGLVFCSTTAPFAERSNAALIAAALNLPEWCLTLDVGASLRSGTSVMGIGFELAAGRKCNLLVATADKREAEPGSPEEQMFGDAGAAVVIGSDNQIATLEARVSRYDDFLDVLRCSQDRYITSFSSKFTLMRGFQENVNRVVEKLLVNAGVRKQAVTKVIMPCPDSAIHNRTAELLGFSSEQIQDPLFNELGTAGCAAPLLSLCAALEAAAPEDRLLLIGYGDGADSFLLRVTDRINHVRNRPSIKSLIERGTLSFSSYQLYAKARSYMDLRRDRLEMSNIFYSKEEYQNIRLYGSRCRSCGLVYFPIAQVCIGCGNESEKDDIPLSRRGTVFTFTIDSLSPSPLKHTVMAVVDLEGGGRLYLQLTDARPEEIEIGMPVELTFRRLQGIHYYWKCCPVR
jgi:hydroxymethylglutaryl-CoA synthase